RHALADHRAHHLEIEVRRRPAAVRKAAVGVLFGAARRLHHTVQTHELVHHYAHRSLLRLGFRRLDKTAVANSSAVSYPSSASRTCASCTAMLPAPTADATRLTAPWRTSPAAKTPGRLVSSSIGGRSSGHAASSRPARSGPVTM